MDYTKGKWQINKWHREFPYEEIRIYALEDDGASVIGLIATMNGLTNVQTRQSDVTLPQEANARLIVQAPKMAALLERLLDISFDTEDENYAEVSALLEDAGEVVAAIEGKV